MESVNHACLFQNVTALNMETVFKLVEGSGMASSGNDSTATDWNMCFFCQVDTSEKLTCPADFANRFQGTGYK